MIGSIYLFPAHRGAIFSTFNSFFALLNGQSLSRTSYPELSANWPQGAYGSTSTTIILPDLTAGYYLRGHSFNTGIDPGLSTRTTPSGTLPVAPSGIGTFQTGQMLSHTHPSGHQLYTQPLGNGGGDGNAQYPVLGDLTTGTPLNISGGVILGNADVTDFDLTHMKCYPYIKIA